MPGQCVHDWTPWASVGVEWRRDCLSCQETDVRSSRPDPNEGTWLQLIPATKCPRQPA